MSKELTPLEALDRLRCFKTLNKDYEFDIIETALKRIPELEKAFHTLSKEDEKAKKLLSKEIERNRALEIIKREPVETIAEVLSFDTFEKLQNHCRRMETVSFIKNEEEFDFLKEILK